jgi:hypothetical protein
LIRGNTIKIPGQVVGIVVQDLKPQDNKCILIVIEPLSSSLREEWDPEIPMLYSLNIYEWDKLKCEVVK